jgi:hypothetical protein
VRVKVPVRLALLWVMTALALAPMWLGPLLVSIETAVAEAQHVCACGMPKGTCGCPECEREQRMNEGARGPMLKGACDPDGSPVVWTDAPPVHGAPLLVTFAGPPGPLLATATPPPGVRSALSPPPPTPPPRLAATLA